MKTIEQLKAKKKKEEELAIQCKEAAKTHEAAAKRIQEEILHRQGEEYLEIFNSINLEEEEFKAAKTFLFKDKNSFMSALNYLQGQKDMIEEGAKPLYE